MKQEFKCANCGKVFEEIDYDENRVVAELKENFGQEWESEDCDVVCDDCYKYIMNILKP